MQFDAILKDWMILGTTISGKVYEDKKERFPDGQAIRTSNIPNLHNFTPCQGMIVETTNTRYLLGNHI